MDNRRNIEYKYRFNEICFIRGKDVIRLNWSNIKSFTILKEYDSYIRPQYVLTMQLDNKTNIWISRYQSDFQVYLDVQKIVTDDEGYPIGPAMQFIKDTFVAYNPTSSSVSIDRIQSEYGTILDTTDINDWNEMMVGSPVTIGLIQRNMFNNSMSACNTIVNKDNMQNIVVSMLTRAGFKKVLMCPFQNPKVYEDIIIPPLPLYRAIQYLDMKYGFYKAGAVIFYDYDTVYVIDTAMKHLVYRRGDNPYATLNIFDSTKEILNGHVLGSKSRELYVGNSTTNITYGEDNYTTFGSTTTVVDINNGSKSDVIYPSKNMNYLESKKVVYGSDQSVEYVRQRQLENSIQITISGYHYDIDAFTPNILTSIYHSNSDIQSRIAGKYRITGLMAELENSGDNFVAKTTVSYVYSGK